jgi:hypothetical protein
MSKRSVLFVLLSVASALLATAFGVTATANAATTAPVPLGVPLSVTLSASSDGASAIWNAAGDPVLTPGTKTSTTYAQVKLNLAPGPDDEPLTPPSFTTDNFTAGSPRWYIQLSNGFYLFGYPAQLGSAANQSFTGDQWSANGPGGQSTGGGYVTYQKALAFANPAGAAYITAAYIVADGDQSAGTHDTLTNVQYGGVTLQVQYSNKVVIKNRLSDRCLNEGAGVLSQYACDAAFKYPSLTWKVATFADGSRYLESVATGEFVKDGTQGQQLSLTGSPSPMGFSNGGIFRFPNSLVMDDKALGRGNFVPTIGWSFNGQNNQRWDFVNAPS